MLGGLLDMWMVENVGGVCELVEKQSKPPNMESANRKPPSMEVFNFPQPQRRLTEGPI